MKPIVVNHPLVSHKLAILRNKNTGTKEFRELAGELAELICIEATRDAKLYEKEIETPIGKTKVHMINEDDYAFLPIMRAGISMVDGVVNVIPNAKIGHIGLYRNEETLEPIKYYFKVPANIDKRLVLILDPMLATGGTACDAIQSLKDLGVKEIRFLCIIAAPEGIEKLAATHPDVQIYCAGIDEKLNEVGYIVPGLGDAGDRIFGTK